MIICNKCGGANKDEAMRCEQCGHKLQSGRREYDLRRAEEKLSLKMDDEARNRTLRMLKPYLEAWGYALILLGATVALLIHRVYWPLYLLAPLLFVILRLRKL